MAKKKEKTKNKKPKVSKIEKQKIVEPTPPKHVSRWEIVESENNENVLVFYDDNGEMLTYLPVTEEHAGEMTEALNRNLDLFSQEPDEWSIIVPEDKEYDPTLNFYSNGSKLVKVTLTESTLEDMNSQLIKLYDPNATKPSKLIPWMTRNRIKTTIGVTILVLFLGYGTFAYFF